MLGGNGNQNTASRRTIELGHDKTGDACNIPENLHLIERVLNGEEVIIARDGKPVARISPILDEVSARVPGLDKGKVTSSSDFDAPLPEFEL